MTTLSLLQQATGISPLLSASNGSPVDSSKQLRYIFKDLLAEPRMEKTTNAGELFADPFRLKRYPSKHSKTLQ